jgi:hypothetical protein
MNKDIRIILIFLSILIPVICNSQNLPTENDIYDFINNTICNDKTENFNLKSCSDKYYNYNDTSNYIYDKEYFDESDFEYFKEQIRALNGINWKKDMMSKANLIDCGELEDLFKDGNGWSNFNKKYGKCLSSFSIPIFNKDNNFCIFNISYACGWVSGHGEINLYQKINDKWVVVKSYVKCVY